MNLRRAGGGVRIVDTAAFAVQPWLFCASFGVEVMAS